MGGNRWHGRPTRDRRYARTVVSSALPKADVGAVRTRDAVRTRAEILEVAAEEFARIGYAGARVDEIAARMSTTKRMIYYYFGGKEQLFIAVLEHAYTRIRAIEQEIDLAAIGPVAAIRELASRTFDHHDAHPDFVRLVSIENIHLAEHMAKSPVLRSLSSPAVDVTSAILAAGAAEGVFHTAGDALDIHMLISAFCVFRVANRHTFRLLFDRDLLDEGRREVQRRMLGDVVVAYLTTPVS